VPTFADRGYHVISVTDPYGHILGLLDRNTNYNYGETEYIVTEQTGITQRFRLVFGRCLIRNPVGTPDILMFLVVFLRPSREIPG
jgi:hypothetical protein